MLDTTTAGYPTSASIENARSGGTIPQVYLAMVDKYGQMVASDDDSKITIGIDQILSTNDSSALKFPPFIEGSTQYTVSGGVVKVSNIDFAATPGYNYSLKFNSDGVDKSKVANKEYLNTIQSTDIAVKVNISLRECEIGE